MWVNTADGSVCDWLDEETISQAFDKVQDEIRSVSSPGLRTSAFSASTDGSQNPYSFPQTVYLALCNKFDNAARVFHLLFARLLMAFWAENKFEAQAIEHLIAHPEPDRHQWRLELPCTKTRSVVSPYTPQE